MNTIILMVSFLAWMICILGVPELNYVNAQNMTNADMAGVMVSNFTSNGNVTDGNATASNTQTDSQSEDEKTGSIAKVPSKCLGSALCPD